MTKAGGACRVCRAPGAVIAFMTVEGASYTRCARCGATLLDPAWWPTPAAERAQYDTHDNRIEDPGYRTFLNRLVAPVLARLAPGAEGLDYGCGPGPALASMMREAGHSMAVYDPLYAPRDSVLTRTYDVVTCSETVEHFHRPAEEFDRLKALVRPGGMLAFMTSFQTDDARFATWHYRRDPTHVVFFKRETFETLARDWGWHCEIPAKNIALLHRPAAI